MAIKGVKLPLIVYAGPFPVWIIFFVTGIKLSQNNRDYKLFWPIFLSATGLILSFIESKYLLTFHNTGLGIKPSSFIFSLGIILVLMSRQIEELFSSKGLILRLISFIGEISFGIYLTHSFLIIVFRAIFADISWGLLWVLVAILNVLLIIIARILLPYKLLKHIGL